MFSTFLATAAIANFLYGNVAVGIGCLVAAVCLYLQADSNDDQE